MEIFPLHMGKILGVFYFNLCFMLTSESGERLLYSSEEVLIHFLLAKSISDQLLNLFFDCLGDSTLIMDLNSEQVYKVLRWIYQHCIGKAIK